MDSRNILGANCHLPNSHVCPVHLGLSHIHANLPVLLMTQVPPFLQGDSSHGVEVSSEII